MCYLHVLVHGLPRMEDALLLAQWIQELLRISLFRRAAWGHVGPPKG